MLECEGKGLLEFWDNGGCEEVRELIEEKRLAWREEEPRKVEEC